MFAIINKIFQVLMDVAIGLASYFALKAFIFVLPDNVIVVIALIVTAAFAEFVEVRLKK